MWTVSSRWWIDVGRAEPWERNLEGASAWRAEEGSDGLAVQLLNAGPGWTDLGTLRVRIGATGRAR